MKKNLFYILICCMFVGFGCSDDQDFSSMSPEKALQRKWQRVEIAEKGGEFQNVQGQNIVYEFFSDGTYKATCFYWGMRDGNYEIKDSHIYTSNNVFGSNSDQGTADPAYKYHFENNYLILECLYQPKPSPFNDYFISKFKALE